MLTVLNYLRVRYMDEKAQGIVEYALLLVFVVTIAIAVLFNNDNSLQTAITDAFGKVSDLVKNHGNEAAAGGGGDTPVKP